jgi:hypothetical protein
MRPFPNSEIAAAAPAALTRPIHGIRPGKAVQKRRPVSNPSPAEDAQLGGNRVEIRCRAKRSGPIALRFSCRLQDTNRRV